MVWNPLKSQNAVRLYTYSLVGSKATKCGRETLETHRPRRQGKVSENIFTSFPKILKGNSNFTILYLPIVSEILLFLNRTQVYHQNRPPTVFIKMWLGLFRCGNGLVWPSEGTMKKVTEQYEKFENDPKALQSVGQIVGEVLKQLNEEKNYHYSYKWTKICCRLSSTAWQISWSQERELLWLWLYSHEMLAKKGGSSGLQHVLWRPRDVSYSEIKGPSEQN